MSFLRSLSLPILIALLVSISTAFAGQTGDDWTGSYSMGIDHFYYGYAYVVNDDASHSGWFSVWAHVGDGGMDYSGGSYEGTHEASAFSSHRTSRSDPQTPSPYWSSHNIV